MDKKHLLANCQKDGKIKSIHASNNNKTQKKTGQDSNQKNTTEFENLLSYVWGSAMVMNNKYTFFIECMPINYHNFIQNM